MNACLAVRISGLIVFLIVVDSDRGQPLHAFFVRIRFSLIVVPHGAMRLFGLDREAVRVGVGLRLYTLNHLLLI